MTAWPDMLGTLPGWITAGGITGLLYVVLRFINDRRKVAADARKTDAEAERIDVEVEDIRIDSLVGQVRRLDARVKSLETQVQDCHQDRDLALAAARYLLDRLRIAAPSDEAIARLQDYLSPPPVFPPPRSMRQHIRDLDQAEEA